MRNDKHLAIKLRRQGNSYNKISKKLNIPKSTLVGWLADRKWSQNIKKELTRKANYISRKRLLFFVKERREKFEKIREGFRIEAEAEFPRLIKNSLFVAGINIYWSEGDNKPTGSSLRISNIDPRMIGVFSSFLRNILMIPEEKIRVGLILYPDLSEKNCKNFWHNVTKIPFDQFYKTQFIYGKHPTRRIEHGICMLIVSSRKYKEKVMKWIDLFSKKYYNNS